MPERYAIDQISSRLWSILDNKNLEISYNLLLTPIKNTFNNWQVNVVTVTSSNYDTDYMTYNLELFSNCFYSVNVKQAISLIYDMVDTIEEDGLDIDNLVELAALFGGLVNNETIKLPPLMYSLTLN